MGTKPTATMADRVAADLARVRWRGLDELDVETSKKVRIDIPALAGLARAYSAAVGFPNAERAAAVRRLLMDGLAAYAEQGNERESLFVARLFFDAQHRLPIVRPGTLLDEAKAAVGVTEDNRFRELQHAHFVRFAAFVIDFVAAARAAAIPAAAPIIDAAPAALTISEPVGERPPVADTEADEAASVPPSDRIDRPAGEEIAATRPHSPRPWGGIVTALLVALSAALALILSVTHTLDRVTTLRPPVATVTRPAAATHVPGQTRREIAGQYGSPTFTDPHSPAVKGPRIEAYQQVQVSCKVFAPTMDSVSPDGYWYQVVSGPWSGHYYAPANNFLNGDSVTGPRDHYTDTAVPDCPS